MVKPAAFQQRQESSNGSYDTGGGRMDRSRRSGERGGGFLVGLFVAPTKSCVIHGLPGYIYLP